MKKLILLGKIYIYLFSGTFVKDFGKVRGHLLSDLKKNYKPK